MLKVFRVVITLSIVWFIFMQIDINLSRLTQMDLEVWYPKIFLLLFSSFLLLFAYVISSLAWREIIKDISRIRLSPFRAISIFLSANLCRYIPGKIWQIGGLAYFSEKSGIPHSVALYSAILGQILALAAASVLSLNAFMKVGTKLTETPWAIILVGLAIIALIPHVLKWLSTNFLTLPEVGNINLPSGWNLLFLKWFGLYLINWILYVVAFWFFCQSFGINHSILLLGSAFSGAYLLGYLAIFSPAGLGIREGSLVILLEPIMLTEQAILLAVLARLWTTFVEIMPGIPLLIRELHSKGKISL